MPTAGLRGLQGLRGLGEGLRSAVAAGMISGQGCCLALRRRVRVTIN